MIRKKITSMSNPVISKAIEIRLRKRSAENRFLAEGPNLVGMAAAAGASIEEIFYTEDFSMSQEGSDLLLRLSRLKSPPYAAIEVTEKVLCRISDTEAPQGISAIVSHGDFHFKDLPSGGNKLIAACDGIQDPGNLGTIIRVSDAAGADAVVMLPGTCDPYSPKTVRATAGSIFNIPIIISDYSSFSEFISAENIGLIATDVRARKSLYDSDLTRSLAFALGNESRGISEVLETGASELVRIPIPGRAESLNVAVAAAVCLYEAVRQRMRA